MNNKKLEERLLKHGDSYVAIINLIEKCESGNVSEIRLTKNEGITNSVILDKMIFTYLKKLKVKITYHNKKIESEKEDRTPKCSHEIHKILSSNANKVSKIKIFKKKNFPMFKIDISSYVICSSCNSIEEIK